MKADDMAAGVVVFTLDTTPVKCYNDLLKRNVLKADELKYFTIPVDSQSILDKFPNAKLGMLDEESTREIIEAPHHSETEALYGYFNSQECSAIYSPETVPNETSTSFFRENQEDSRSAREVVPLENIYRLLEEESQSKGSLQMETFGRNTQPNITTAVNQWQSDSYQYPSETSSTTSTSSIMSTVENNWQSGNYAHSSKTSFPESTSLNDALVSSNQQSEIEYGYSNSQESYAFLPTETLPTVPITHFPREIYENQGERRCAKEVVPLKFSYALLAEESPAMGNLEVETFELVMKPSILAAKNQWQSGNHMHCSETAFSRTNASNATISNNQNFGNRLDMNSLSGEFIPSTSDDTVFTYGIYQNFAAVRTDKPTITTKPNSSPSSFTQSVSQRIQLSETSFPTATSSNAVVSPQQMYEFPLDTNFRTCDFAHSVSDVTVPSNENFTDISREESTMITLPVTCHSSFTQSVSQGVSHFGGAIAKADAINPSLHFQKDNKQRSNYTKLKPSKRSFCKSPTSHSFDLNRSVVVNSGEKPHVCHICGKGFNRTSSLSNHFKSHTRKKPYACEICNKMFVNKHRLNTHNKIHTGQRPYACEICNKTFVHKHHLNTHTKFHTGQRAYACEICNKTFVCKHHLNRHTQIHTRERLYA